MGTDKDGKTAEQAETPAGVKGSRARRRSKAVDLAPEAGSDQTFDVIDAIPSLVSYIGTDLRYKFVNHKYTEWFGKPADDIVGHHLRDVLGETVYEKILPEVRRALAGEAVTFNRFLEYKNGPPRYTRITYTPDWRGKEVVGFTAMVVDVSEQHDADKALAKSEERYRAFVEQSSEGIWRFELEQPMPIDIPIEEQVAWAYKYGYLAECNDAMARQYGLTSAADLIGLRLGDLLVESDPSNTEFLRAFFAAGFRLNDAESHERDPHGNDRYFLNNFVGFVENGFLKRAWGTQRDITETKSADRIRARLAAIVESSDDAILSKDLDGIVTSWNRAAERMFGVAAEEMLGQPITLLIPPERVTEELTILERIRSGETVEHFETQRKRKDGTLLDISLSVSPIRDGSGNVIGASSIALDITQRKLIERTLDENRMMLAMAMQSGRMGAWERDIVADTVTWSEELEEIFGLGKGEFRGTEEHFFEFIHEDDREAVWYEVQRALQERRPYAIDFRFRHADGSIRWMEGRGEAVYSEAGEPIRIYGIGIDITDRMLVEKALRESELRFRFALSSEAVTVYEQDRDLRYNWLFPTGPYPTETVGKTDLDLAPGPDGEHLTQLKRKVLETGQSLREEISVTVGGERRWYDLVIEPRLDPNGLVIGIGGAAVDVTERKRVSEELRRSEERLKAMFDATTVGLAVMDTNARFLQINDAYCDMTGYSRQELTRKDRLAITHPEDTGLLRHEIEQLRSGAKTSLASEKRFIRCDGSVIWVQDNLSMTRDSNGEPLHLISISLDVTERKQAEEALRESEQRFSRFMQHLPGLAWIKDITGRYVYANEAAERSFGIAAQDLYGKTDMEVFPAESAEQFVAHDRRAIESGSGLQVIESLVEDDGILHHSVVSKFPISGADGQPALIGGMAIDITEQKHAEDALRRRMEFDEAVMANMGEGLYTVDAQGRVTSMNPAAERLFGWTFDELKGLRLHDVVHHKHRDGTPFPAEDCAGSKVLSTGELLANYDDVFIRKDGTFFDVVYSSAPIRENGEITGLVVVFQDVTDRKQTEGILQRYRVLSEYARDIIWLLAPDGRFIEVNQAAVEAYGYSREELLQMNVRDLRHSAALDELDDQLKAAGTSGIYFETTHIRKDGSSFPVEVNANSAVIGGERLIMSIVRDISERKRQETNHDFLLRIGELIRSESNPSFLFEGTVAMVGEHLKADRAFVTSIDRARRTSTMISEYRSDSMRPLAPHVNLDEYPEANLRSAAEGQTIVVADTRTDERTAAYFAHCYEPEALVSYVAVPLMRAGEWTAMFFISRSEPHEWSEWEISLVQTVAERTWLAAERLRSEARLRASEKRYRTLFDLVRVAVYTCDARGVIQEYNEQAVELWGREPESGDEYFCGSWKIYYPDGRPMPHELCPMAKVLRGEAVDPDESELLVERPDGSRKNIIANPRLIYDENGLIAGAINCLFDITEVKAAQKAAVAAERRAIVEYQKLLERIVPLAETLGAARDLLTIYRSMQEFICASMSCSGFFISFYDGEKGLRQAAYVWGEGEEIDITTLPPMSISPGGGPNSRAILEKRTIITKRYWDEQKQRPHVVINENGRDPMSSLVVPMIVQNRVVGTLEVQAYEEDVFHREQAIALEMAANLAAVAIENVRLIEIEATARADAEAANRMKDEFLSVLSHELRTPLNAMLGWVRILRGGHVDPERSEKALEIIERNTRQQSSLIEDLLDVSRIISGKMKVDRELIDLVPSIHQVAESVQPLAQSKNISFKVIGDTEPLYMKGDAVRLQQVITNLLQNAVKFTPAGGNISLSYKRRGPIVIIKVLDDGEGIEPEFLPLIFDRFSQADATTRRHNTGLGLGLTIVRNIVELHGGRTLAESDGPGTGTAITVELPLAEEFYRQRLTDDGSRRPNGHSPSLDGFRILLVDDDPDSLLPLRILLEREKATVYCATSAEEALDRLWAQDFHILISDIGMPSVDGFQLISRLRKDRDCRNANIKAIAFTAYASEDDRQRVLSAGYHAHLAKPLDFDQLVEMIRNFSQLT